MIITFLDFVIMVPTRSPMGVMDISTPTLKNNIPMMSRAAPTRNVIKMLGGMGAMVKHSSKTMPRIGNTAFNVSENFSLNLECVECKSTRPFLLYFEIKHPFHYIMFAGKEIVKKLLNIYGKKER